MIETNFKHTEIGLIPHDWEVKTLGEIAEYRRGSFPQPYGLPEWYGGVDAMPFVQVADVGEDFRLNQTTKQTISKKAQEYSVFVPKNSVLVTLQGSIGRVAITQYDGFVDRTLAIFQHYIIPMANNYFAHQLSKKFAIEREKAPGGIIKTITKEAFTEFEIPLPPTLAEQERIAGALSSIDTLIGALNEQIEKKRHIKQGTMQQLLTGKKRLAGFTGEWKICKIKDIVGSVKRGQGLQSKDYVKGNIPVVAGGKQYAGFHNVANHLGCTITISGSGANAGYVAFHAIPIFATDCSVIDDNDDFVLAFVYYMLLNKQGEIYKLQSGGAQPHIYPKNIEDIIVSIPPTIAEQSAIAAVLSGMDVEIAALEQKRDKYTAIKQGMMQQLLTGRIRLLEEETQEKPIVQTIQPLQKQRTANVFFRRSVLAAEIADRLCEKRRFGHVKMEKLIFMTEKMCGIDLASHYHRDAAGPYDNRALRSIDSQLKKQKWFEAKSITEENGNRRYTYMPLANRGGHKQYFDLYYADVLPEFDNVINTMADWNTEHCEIIATLYSAWEDLLHSGNAFTDDDILNELYHRWHDSKKRFSAPRLLSALTWMRQNNFIPKK